MRPLLPTLVALILLVNLVGCGERPATSTPGPIDEDAPSEFQSTDSGLRYRVLRASDGPKPGPEDRVTVDYVGWLDSRREFDNSYNRRGPATFRLSEVVPGWTEGLQLIGEGGMIELEIPSDLGYGSEGSPGSIPPDATLHFRVELHKIE